MGDFNPYLAWLDIGPHEHPISDHRLLGLRAGETDPGVIAAAAATVLAHLEQFTAGVHADRGRQLLAEVAAARDRLLHGGSPARSPAGAERQIKAPPPVPTATPATKPASPSVGGFAATQMLPLPGAAPSGVPPIETPSPAIRMPPPPDSHPQPSGAPLTPAPPTPGAGVQAPAYRPLSQPDGGVSLTLASAGLPSVPASASEVTPVGVPLGTIAPSASVPYAVPQNTPPAPPPPAPPAPPKDGEWIPKERGGRVGKSIAGAGQQELSPNLPTTSATRVRRASRHKTSFAWTMLAVGGVCLVLLLIVLAIVAKNS